MFEWDEAKRRRNLAKHGVDFETVWELDWGKAVQRTDARRNYGEVRYVALVYIGGQLYSCAYTERDGARRIISLRKASRKERGYYEEEIFDD
ncbi:MAG: BrnT family toxin [Pseudomonadota bacterium]|nr:BrnT family toxin [Pseudomonadota bacterium]MDE3037389.1 BrnT family toxin [Pseudomonadota bacterium]